MAFCPSFISICW